MSQNVLIMLAVPLFVAYDMGSQARAVPNFFYSVVTFIDKEKRDHDNTWSQSPPSSLLYKCSKYF